MRGVILAAGRGKRLASMGFDKPKCLLPFGDQTLLDNIVASLGDNGIDRLAVVVGYRQELVLETVRRHPVHVDVVVNSDYAQTNTINSLYLAREHLGGDFVYFNADVLFDRRIVGRLLSERSSALAVEVGQCAEEEVKVIVDGEGRIVQIGKELRPGDCLGEFIGVGVFRAEVNDDLVDALRYYNEELEERGLFFEAAVERICDRHVVRAVDIDPYRAIEIDTPADLEAARALSDTILRSR